MKCDCIEELTAKIDEQIRQQLPDGFKDYSIELGGFSFCIVDNRFEQRPALPITGSYLAPKKRGGGYTKKKISQSLVCKFCPICGERTDEDNSND